MNEPSDWAAISVAVVDNGGVVSVDGLQINRAQRTSCQRGRLSANAAKPDGRRLTVPWDWYVKPVPFIKSPSNGLRNQHSVASTSDGKEHACTIDLATAPPHSRRTLCSRQMGSNARLGRGICSDARCRCRSCWPLRRNGRCLGCAFGAPHARHAG